MPDRAAHRFAAPAFCHLCGTQLLSRYYTYDDRLTVCSACHASRPRCGRCRVPLDDAAIAASRAAPSGEPALCGQCRRTAPRCDSCRGPIIGTYYTFEEVSASANARRFCGNCVAHRPRCDLCRAPVAPGAVPLDDGQYRCDLCTRDLVRRDAEVQVIYREALAAFERLVGDRLRETPRLEVVSRLRMGEVRRRHEPASAPAEIESAAGHHVLGYFVRSNNISTVYVERALTRGLLLGTLAHELGHAWQTERAPSLRDPLLSEGFAEWAAHHVLLARGHQALAARSTRRDDLYGRGLRQYLDIEHRGGRAAVLAAARGGRVS